MKKKSIFLIISISFIFFISCLQQVYKVHPITEYEKFAGKHGIFYFLPRTVIHIIVEIEKVDRIRGPFFQYCAKYLGVRSQILENQSLFFIKDIHVILTHEPDPEKIYFIQLPRQNQYLLQFFEIMFQESGIIHSFNTPYKLEPERNFDLSENHYSASFDLTASPQIFKMFTNKNIMEKLDTIIEFVHIDTILVQKRTIQKSYIEKHPEQQAREIAEQIHKLNDYKISLLSGYQEIAYDKNTIEYMVNKLDSIIQEYISLFTGKIITQNMQYSFTIVPDKSFLNKQTFLFCFNKINGIKDKPSKNEEENIFIEFIPGITTARLSEVIHRQLSQKDLKKGLYYNIPEKTKIVITRGREELLYEQTFLINQFGQTYFLPPHLLDVQFFDETGFIRYMKGSKKINELQQDRTFQNPCY